jgi:methylenetetrahydrofolate dehydrogenase (NADP+)/methenyltetrahydrofolate cyclohydrolase
MILLDGRKLKENGLNDLKDKINKCDRKLGFAVIQVGNNPASDIYVSQKQKTAISLGCEFHHIKFDENIDEEVIINKIDELNKDDLIDGILVQTPLPRNLNESRIQNRVLAVKDVDGLTDINSGLLFHNKECLIPCTPLGVLNLLKSYNIEISGKHVVIVGRSNLVGRPLMSLMLNNDATVTICHSKSNGIENITKMADILIVAAGKRDLIKSSMVKDGAVVIDVGINRIDDKLYGDVDFEDVKYKTSYITPVPGGVGQMTVLSLFQNLYKAYEMRKKN